MPAVIIQALLPLLRLRLRLVLRLLAHGVDRGGVRRHWAELVLGVRGARAAAAARVCGRTYVCM